MRNKLSDFSSLRGELHLLLIRSHDKQIIGKKIQINAMSPFKYCVLQKTFIFYKKKSFIVYFFRFWLHLDMFLCCFLRLIVQHSPDLKGNKVQANFEKKIQFRAIYIWQIERNQNIEKKVLFCQS